MEARDFVRAILDDLDEEFPRLVFADWLEETGQVDRAEWVRASCELTRLAYRGPGWLPTRDRVYEAWKRCRPSWMDFRDYPANDSEYDWRFFENKLSSWSKPFEPRNLHFTDLRRLAALPWLDRAFEEGWLSGFEIGGMDADLAGVLSYFKTVARSFPFHIKVLESTSDVSLAVVMNIPHLWGLELPASALLQATSARLGDRDDLRVLAMDLKGLGPNRAASVLKRVGRLAGLRQLGLENFKPGGDADFEFLDGLPGLRQLSLARCSALTGETLARIGRLPGLKKLTLKNCRTSVRSGVERLRLARPDLNIDYS